MLVSTSCFYYHERQLLHLQRKQNKLDHLFFPYFIYSKHIIKDNFNNHINTSPEGHEKIKEKH